MVSKSFVVALAAAGCVVAGPSPAEEAAVTAKAMETGSSGFMPHVPQWASTVSPEKLASLQKDMHSLGSSIKGNRLYTSMTAVMATAVPKSFKHAMLTNPASVHKQYKTSKPEWYQAIPSDVRSFMEDNRRKAKSIFSHDIGPMPTHTKAHDATATGNKDKSPSAAAASASGKSSKSEADSMRVVGAAVCALFSAFGVAVLLL